MEISPSDICDKGDRPRPKKVDYACSMETNETYHNTPCKTYHSQRTLLSPMQMPFDRMSPRNFSTPKKHATLRKIPEMETSEPGSSMQQSYSFKFLPKFATPPTCRSLQEFVAKNPFDAELQKKLHLPIFSPSVFKRCVSPSKECQDSFVWTIDDLSRIHPAPIEEDVPDHHQPSVFSPDTESRTQQAIESYFCTTQVLQSPWPANGCVQTGVKKTSASYVSASAAGSSALSEDNASRTDLVNAWTQTVLSLPPVLPPDVEAALLPFCTFHQEQREQHDESWQNTSLSVLRRKLFGEQDCDEGGGGDEGEEDMSVASGVTHATPDKRHYLFSKVLCAENLAPRSYVSPLPGSQQCRQLCAGNLSLAPRSYGSPLPGSQHSQRSPSISPISYSAPLSGRNRSTVSARLDFSAESMSVDQSGATSSSSPEEGSDPYPASTNHPAAFSFSADSMHVCRDTGYGTKTIDTCDLDTGCSTPGCDGQGSGCQSTLWQPTSRHITSSTPAK